MNKKIYELKTKVPKRVLYELLAEESAELTQASLKYIRASGLSNNPTNISENVAMSNLNEEINDVLLMLVILFGQQEITLRTIKIDEYTKIERWLKRLNDEQTN